MKGKSIVLAAAAVAAVGVFPGAAGAEPEAAGADTTAATCTYVAKQAVYLRALKTNQSTGLAWIAQGERFNGPCVIETGQRLGACLPGAQTDILWTRGRKDGHAGWVFTACARFVS